jgi:chromosome segregation ATPase
MKWKIYLAGAVLILAVAAGWYRTQIKLAEERGARAEVVSDYNELKAKYEADSTTFADSLRTLKAETEAALEELDVIESDLEFVRSRSRARLADLESQLDAIPDSLEGPVRETLSALEDEAETCSLALSNCHVVIDRQTEQIVTLEGSLSRTQRQLIAANATIGRLEQPIGAGGTVLPWILVGAEALIILAMIIFGG